MHDNDYPLWAGPCGAGQLGGITQSIIGRFLGCRERFRLKYICGLEPPDRWSHHLGYGNMWHVCEEGLAADVDPILKLRLYTQAQLSKYPLQRDEIAKWANVCAIQFPEYVKYWAEHPDVKDRQPLMQEQVFDVSYRLPSGRTVRLRGKWDSVDLIDGAIWLQENKTKGDIDKLQVERQLSFDLQTMMYLVALQAEQSRLDDSTVKAKTGYRGLEDGTPNPHGAFRHHYPVLGVRYNVVRRPLSGGKGSIRPHGAKSTKTSFTPAETEKEFYERLRRDYIAAEPEYWFFRIRAEIGQRDIEVFRKTCLDPVLETICCWYEQITDIVNRFTNIPPMNYRTPFGIYNPLDEGGATEYDAYLATGSEAGLRRTEELFPELA